MLKTSLRTLAVVAIAAFSLGPVPAAAVTPVSACGPLDKAGETYVLTADITLAVSGQNCLVVSAERITIDLAGHTITGLTTAGGGGISDDTRDRASTVVKNGTITNFGVGIFLNNSSRGTIRNVTTSDNGIGIWIGQNVRSPSAGPVSLVKDCIAQRNLLYGIITGSGVQVEGCVLGGDNGNGNGFFGLVGEDRMLVTRNTVSGNGTGGIAIGNNSTVTHNTANANGLDTAPGTCGICHGIAVGRNSLVTRNTANGNRDDGINVTCPSTVTNNTASTNGLGDIVLVGAGCFHKDNVPPAVVTP